MMPSLLGRIALVVWPSAWACKPNTVKAASKQCCALLIIVFTVEAFRPVAGSVEEPFPNTERSGEEKLAPLRKATERRSSE